ncbi:TonB-dependent receptor [Flagellimonas iocasae]|uniref:TonB-dependent receptor n=1 Tax=Flagellimonas iocasae TaxID=2055905 RepID=A0ABW4XZQ2_9FLAO
MRKIFSVVFFLAAIMAAHSQTSVRGNIVNSETSQPLENASVYISQINKATASDTNGNFQFSGLGKGVYSLQVSFLGFESEVETLTVEDEKEVIINIKLDPQPFAIQEVVVAAAYEKPQQEETFKIDVIPKEQLSKTGGMSVMDIIPRVPGVDAVTTGPLVSRPVIRGLSSNRVLTIVDAIRFETQQWDDEHGIGINELGMDHIEIIKGPSSLLYGPEAMGGIVRFVEEKPAEVGTTKADVEAMAYSNNRGGRVEASIKSSKENFNWGFRALGKLLSDYFYDGFDFRVPNTRLLEYGAKGFAGINKPWGNSKLSYTFNKAYYGILDGKDIVKDEDGRIINIDSLEKEKFPFEIEAPYHGVTDHRIISKTTLLTGASTIKATLGYQNNHRTENEELAGSKKGYTYLDMILKSYTYDVKWVMPTMHNFHTIVGSQGMLKTNTNGDDGTTQLIPDATIKDIGLFGVSRYEQDRYNFSVGVRYDHRNLDTEESQDPSVFQPAISRSYDNLSYSLGAAFEPIEHLIFRASVATGYRSPNLNELMSNGVKLESQRFEVGNSDFTKETNTEFDGSIAYEGKEISMEGSAFYNSINDYIYITPTSEEVSSNLDPDVMVPLFEFQQNDAHIYGGEFMLNVHPTAIPWGHLESSVSTLKGQRSDNDAYLYQMPPTKWNNDVFITWDHLGQLTGWTLNVGTNTSFEQHQVAPNEMETDGYTLLHLGLDTHFKKMEFFLNANNVLDTKYLNHMSRFRSYEIYSPGRNISLGIKMPLM